jgi:hypothetical protein
MGAISILGLQLMGFPNNKVGQHLLIKLPSDIGQLGLKEITWADVQFARHAFMFNRLEV